VVTNDEHLHVRLRELKDQGRPVRGTGGDDVHHTVGYNFKFTNLQAAVGLAQLTYLEPRLARMKRTYSMYAQELGNLKGIRLPGFCLDAGECPQWTDAIIERRDDLDRVLLARNVHCRRFWFPIHSQAPYRLPDGLFPNSSIVCRKALWLPSSFTLSDADVMDVCGYISEFLTTRANDSASAGGKG
jgi:perosamine synthetase